MSLQSLRPPSAAQPESAPPLLEYDGRAPFPCGGTTCERTGNERLSLTITALIVFLPFLALGLVSWLLWGRLIHPVDVLLATVLYTVTGLGVTVGFHRGLTHGGYRAVRPLRIALATAGSMSFQGDVIGWVAIHRRHHAFTDRPGDPHSPYRYGTSVRGQLRGWRTPTSAGCSATSPHPRRVTLPTSSPTATSGPCPGPSRPCVCSPSSSPSPRAG